MASSGNGDQPPGRYSSGRTARHAFREGFEGLDRKCPLPHYETFEPPSVPNQNSATGLTHMYCATCTLPHLGVQITPEVSYNEQECAIENAALSALVYLEGGFDRHSKECNISFVGCAPSVNNPINEQAERFAALERGADVLQGDGPSCLQTNSQGIGVGIEAGRQSNIGKRQKSRSCPPQMKNAIQELKELCDRKRWVQPRYDYTLENGLFVCTVDLTSAKIQGIATTGHTNQKQSKLEAAQLVITELTSQGLYQAPYSQQS